MNAQQPRWSPQCLVCQSPLVADADAAIRGGAKLTVVARKTGLPYQSLKRHRRNGHVAGDGTSAPTRAKDDSPPGVLREALDALRGMDPARMSQNAAIARIDAIRRTADALSKIEPPDPNAGRVMTVEEFGKVVVADNGATFDRLLEAWFVALEPHPEARSAMFDATQRTLGVAPDPRDPRATIMQEKEEKR
jgi:hypothetical protein